MEIEETMDYSMVKSTVLHKFEIHSESYCVRFRTSVVEDEETSKGLQVHLKDVYEKWMVAKEKTKELIGDAIVMEQFFRVLNPEVCTWIKERNPTTSKQAAEMAEAFLSARHSSAVYPINKPNMAAPLSGKTVRGDGHRAMNYRQGPSSSNVKEFRNRGPLLCHSCGQPGHFKADCPGQHVSKTYMYFSPKSAIS